MKKIMFAAAFLLLSMMSLSAQEKVGTYNEWKKIIDNLEVKVPYDFSGRKTVVILPVETSEVELPKKNEDTYPIVTKTLKNMQQMVAAEMQKQLQKQGYTVTTSDDPAYRDENAIVIKLNWTEFNLGSRALRVWVGFGAGNAGFATNGVIFDGDKEVIAFAHRRIAPMDTKKYDQLAVKGVNSIAQDLAKMVLNL